MSIADSRFYGHPHRRGEVEKRLATKIDWRLPSESEKDAFSKHPHLSKIGDSIIAATDTDKESWILLERDWFGFPDPPRFAFFAYQLDGKKICAADLDDPSPLWCLPEGVPFQLSKEI